MTNSEIKCEHENHCKFNTGSHWFEDIFWCRDCGSLNVHGNWNIPTRTPEQNTGILSEYTFTKMPNDEGDLVDVAIPRTPGPTKLSDYACSSCGVLAGHAFNCKPEPTNIHKLDFEITKIFEELRVMHDVPKSVLESLEGLIRKRNPEPTKAENGLDINNLKNLDLFKLSEEELDDLLFVLKKTIAVINIKESPSITKEQLLAILPEKSEICYCIDEHYKESLCRDCEANAVIDKMKQRIEELGK